jgi:CheY-like chemotaxis protein
MLLAMTFEGNVSRKVLIVDDSKLARMAVIRVLSVIYPDWSAEEAANADQALASFKRNPPDFVLLDFNMPGKDGLVLAGELRELNPSVCVAVISANHQQEVISRAKASGAAFLPKPLTDKALSDFLNTARPAKVAPHG